MKLLILFITPIVLAILLDILFECDVQSMCSFIVRPRKLNSFIIVILVWLISMSRACFRRKAIYYINYVIFIGVSELEF